MNRLPAGGLPAGGWAKSHGHKLAEAAYILWGIAMFGLGMPELIVIMGITFLVFGGKKLPELGAGLGKGIKAFKTGLRDVEDTGKALMEKNVPGFKEVTALKDEVKEIKNISPLKS